MWNYYCSVCHYRYITMVIRHWLKADDDTIVQRFIMDSNNNYTVTQLLFSLITYSYLNIVDREQNAWCISSFETHNKRKNRRGRIFHLLFAQIKLKTLYFPNEQ